MAEVDIQPVVYIYVDEGTYLKSSINQGKKKNQIKIFFFLFLFFLLLISKINELPFHFPPFFEF